MDPVSITLSVITMLWNLTIGVKKALGDSEANKERVKRLESRAKAFARIVGEAGNLYGIEITGPGDLPATVREKEARNIQEALSECEKDLKCYNEKFKEILRSQGRGNPIVTSIKDKLFDNDLGLYQIEKSITDHQRNLQLLMQVIQGHRISEIQKNLFQFLWSMIAQVKSSRVSQLPKRPGDADKAATGPQSPKEINLTPTQSANHGAHEGEESLEDAEDSILLYDSLKSFFTEYLDSLGDVASTGEEQPNMGSNSWPIETWQRSDVSPGISTTQNSSGISLVGLTPNTSHTCGIPEEESKNPSRSQPDKDKIMVDGDSGKNATAQSIDLQSKAKGEKLLESIKKDEPLDTIQHSLGNDRMSLEERNELGQTPLILAASSGKVDVVKSLVQHGANVEAKDQDEATALHVAIEKAHWLVVSVLLQPEAHTVNEATKLDVNSSDNLGRTPLHKCALLNCSDEPTITAIQQLLDLGAEINVRDKGDYTPLYYALKGFPKYEVVELLLQNDPDVNFEWPPDISPRMKDVLEKHSQREIE